jgi:hypothetical protein
MHNSRANSKYLIAAASIVALLQMMPQAQAARNDSRAPRYAPAIAPSRMSAGKLMEPKNLPEFAEHSYSPTSGTRIGGEGDPSGPGTALKIGAQSTTLPTETRLKLVLECSVDAKESKPGDIFEAHVKDDLAVGTQLLLPRGSLVRGRVVEVARPRLISRAAKIGLKLEQIVTPTGEVIPLDAALEFRKGTSNEKGQLDPGTSFGSRHGALMAANIATLGAPAAATLIGSSAVALFRSGDNVSLSPGQELEVLLTQDLGLQVN